MYNFVARNAVRFHLKGNFSLLLRFFTGRYDIKRIGESVFEKRKIFGDIFREKFGRNNAVVSFNPDDLQTMYKYEGVYPSRSTLESLKAYRELRKDWYKSVGVVLL